ncbi:MAG TPA: penicillin-binding transpeptidase domain-containing protein [Ktedonobacteraceae bacterium]|nr:penicillin-binding transpeptidase domain-containing protein [Ktedonobacteraceae bacterium]
MNISKSIGHLINVFFVLFLALSAGLVYWQAVVAQQVSSNTYLNYTRNCTSDAAPKRGTIYDRNGVKLAYSVKSDIPGLCGYKRVYTDAAKGLEGLLGYYISPLLTFTGVEKQFDDYLNGTKGITNLSNTVNRILHVPPQGNDIYLTIDSRIEKILLDNFSLQDKPDYNSVYPADKGSVIVANPQTGEILGIVSQPGFDANCVVSCSFTQLRNNMQAKGYDKTIKCADSCSVDQFKQALDQYKPLTQYGYSSKCEQQFNCNQIYLNFLNTDPKRPLIFRPTQDCYAPGSTYKAMTLMAALDAGSLTLNDKVFYNDPETNPFPKHLQALGPITIGEGDERRSLPKSLSNIDTYTKRFPVDLAYGFSHSDNIIFAQAGVLLGPEKWLKYNHDFYVGEKIPFDLPVKVSTVTPQKQANLCANEPPPDTPLSVSFLADNAFGQGVDFMTPLQMMLINNVAANDGKLMRPTIISKIVDPASKSVLQTFTPQTLKQVVSQRTAQLTRDGMVGVNECGSGQDSRVKLSFRHTPWAIVGKTGTAQVPNPDPTKVLPANSWYITQAPYVYKSNMLPAITITAMKESGGEGAYANGPMLNVDYNDIFTKVMKDVPRPAPLPGGENFCYATGLLQA